MAFQRGFGAGFEPEFALALAGFIIIIVVIKVTIALVVAVEIFWTGFCQILGYFLG